MRLASIALLLWTMACGGDDEGSNAEAACDCTCNCDDDQQLTSACEGYDCCEPECGTACEEAGTTLYYSVEECIG